MFKNPGYEVKLVTFKDPVLDAEVQGYGIFNISTGVCEAECRRYNTARMFCKQFYEADVEEANRELEEASAANAHAMQ